MNRNFLDWATLALAAMGFALGVVNYLTDLFRRRPRGTVAVRNYYSGQGIHVGLGVSVVNNGEVPFTVDGVFVELGRGKMRVWDRFQHGDELPKLLDPGMHCKVVLSRASYLDDAVKAEVVRVAVTTPSGAQFHSQKLARKFLDVPPFLSGKDPGPRTVEMPAV